MKMPFISHSGLLWVVILLIVVLILACRSKIQNEQNNFYSSKTKHGVYLKKSFQSTDGKLKYRILFPDSFDVNEKYPVLLFLHGAGERGNDNKAQQI